MGVVVQKTVGTQLEIGPSIVGYNGITIGMMMFYFSLM